MSEKKVPYLERTLDKEVPELRPYLWSGAKVLDIGCGPGTITLNVAEVVKPGQAVGIDIKEEMIQRACELAADVDSNNVTFKVMDTHALDFADETFDVVFSHTAFHDFRDPVGALKEEKRVTKRGGWVIAAGVRDWGLVPRYPPTPTWDSVYEAWVRFNTFVRDRPDIDIPSVLDGGHPQAARRCAEWFLEAGLDDLKIEVKVHRIQYPGAEEAEPHPIDLLPYADDGDEFGWYAIFDTSYKAMMEYGFI